MIGGDKASYGDVPMDEDTKVVGFLDIDRDGHGERRKVCWPGNSGGRRSVCMSPRRPEVVRGRRKSDRDARSLKSKSPAARTPLMSRQSSTTVSDWRIDVQMWLEDSCTSIVGAEQVKVGVFGMRNSCITAS